MPTPPPRRSAAFGSPDGGRSEGDAPATPTRDGRPKPSEAELEALERRLEAFFAPGGVLSSAHPRWEPREGQLAMARAVLRTLGRGGHLVVEAGTGTGKTLAYLVPAALLGRRVIVSTGTKALQDQLVLKDLPFLTEACRLPVRSIALKGRDNYLCLHRLERFRQQPLFPSRAEAAVWPRVLDWAEETEIGDLAELTGVPESPRFWREINAAEPTCLGRRCPRHEDCHLHSVRREAHEADLVVVNHHLYLADAVTRAGEFGAILPDADLVVFDEAHRIEAAATSFFGVTVSDRRLMDLADDAATELDRSALSVPTVRARTEEVRAAARALAAPWGRTPGRRLMPARFSDAQEDAVHRVRGALLSLLAALESVGDAPQLTPFRRRARELMVDLELVVGREDPTWVHWVEVRGASGRGVGLTASPVEVGDLLRSRVFSRLSATVLCSATLAVGGSMGHVRSRLGLVEPAGERPDEPTGERPVEPTGERPDEPKRGRSEAAERRARRGRVSRSARDAVDELGEAAGLGRLGGFGEPGDFGELVIDVGPGEDGGAGEPGRGGAEEDGPLDDEPLGPVEELVLASPYDFASQGLLYLPRRFPDPRSASWRSACVEAIEELVSLSRGRAFLLFTSRDAMHRAHEALADELPWPVLLQGETSKREILARFVSEPGSVLFATASFWEGVDVPGEALSLVVVDKLPFAVPSDPLQAARARLVEEAGGSPFRDLAMPEAVLALKQGVGRLIRSHSDRGVVALLDARVTGTAWGRRFLRDLPPFRTTRDVEDVRSFFAAEPDRP